MLVKAWNCDEHHAQDGGGKADDLVSGHRLRPRNSTPRRERRLAKIEMIVDDTANTICWRCQLRSPSLTNKVVKDRPCRAAPVALSLHASLSVELPFRRCLKAGFDAAAVDNKDIKSLPSLINFPEPQSRMMPLKVCLSTAYTLLYPQGGHLWVFINWALGLRSWGCEVTWLDLVPTTLRLDELVTKYEHLRKTLHPFGLDANLVVDFLSSEDLTDRLHERAIPCIEGFAPFDLLVDTRYDLPERLFANFRRKALINIDPGLYELGLALGVYPDQCMISCFQYRKQHRALVYTPPCVFLDEWPFTLGSNDFPWITSPIGGGRVISTDF